MITMSALPLKAGIKFVVTNQLPSSKFTIKICVVIDDLDIYRGAVLLIKQHGELASIEAVQRADQLLADGDVEGHHIWQRILKAIKELQDMKPAGSVH